MSANYSKDSLDYQPNEGDDYSDLLDSAEYQDNFPINHQRNAPLHSGLETERENQVMDKYNFRTEGDGFKEGGEGFEGQGFSGDEEGDS